MGQVNENESKEPVTLAVIGCRECGKVGSQLLGAVEKHRIVLELCCTPSQWVCVELLPSGSKFVMRRVRLAHAPSYCSSLINSTITRKTVECIIGHILQVSFACCRKRRFESRSRALSAKDTNDFRNTWSRLLDCQRL